MRYAHAVDHATGRRGVGGNEHRAQTDELYNYRTGEMDRDIAGRIHAVVEERRNREVVNELISLWEAEVINASDFADMTSSKYYEAIVAVGTGAVESILERLATGPSWIVLALEEIVGYAPYGDDALGDLEKITRAWVEWGSGNRSS